MHVCISEGEKEQIQCKREGERDRGRGRKRQRERKREERDDYKYDIIAMYLRVSCVGVYKRSTLLVYNKCTVTNS